MELREKIAQALLDNHGREWLAVADAILAMPEIAEALARADECPRLRVDDDDI